MKTDGVGLGVLTAASALMETHEFGKEMEHVVDNLATFGRGKDNSTYCAQFATSLTVHRSYYLSLKRLLDWDPKPKVKMKLIKFSSQVFYEEKSTDLGTADKEISNEVSIALDRSGVEPSQWWIQERSVAGLLEASVSSNGPIRSASEAAGDRERVLCLKRLTVVQGHYLSWEWLFAWFPRPMVKKVKRLVSVIPCGQGILRGMDCYEHKLKERNPHKSGAGIERHVI